MAKGLVVRFDAALCKCGNERVVAQPCGKCGTLPPQTEVDPALDRRRKLADAARLVDPFVVDLRSPGFDPSPPERVLEYLWPIAADAGDLGDLASALLDGGPASNPGEFLAAVARLMGVAPSLDLATERRPMRALRNDLVEVGECLRTYVDKFLDALVAPTPGEAQTQTKIAQAALDKAGDRLTAAFGKLDAWRADDDADPWVPISGTPVWASTRSGASDVLEYGEAQLGRVFPEVVNREDIRGIAGLAWSQTEAFMDAASFEAAARRVFELLVAYPNRLVALAATDYWLASWDRTMDATFETAYAFLESTRRPPSDQYEVRQTINLAQQVQESVVKPLIATVSAVVLDHSYQHELGQGVHCLLDWAQSNGILVGQIVAVPTRQAGAHDDWRLDGDDIWLREIKPDASGAPIRTTRAELLDHVIELQELSLSLVIGVRAALAHLGVDVAQPAAPKPLADAYAKTVLTTAGWQHAGLDRDHSSIVVTANVEPGCSLSPLFDIGALFAETELVAYLNDGSSESVVRIDLDAQRSLDGAECDQIWIARMTGMMANSRVNDIPLASREAVRHQLAQVALWAAGIDDHHLAVAAFRIARDIADVSGDPELKGVLKNVQGWRRTKALNLQRDYLDRETVAAWIKADAPLRMHL